MRSTARVILVPLAALNLLVGTVYGITLGMYHRAGQRVGAWLAFMVGCRFLRRLVQDARQRSLLWYGLAEVAPRQPIRLTTLWHFSLVMPFSIINHWMCGSEVRVWDFLLGKPLGALPAT